MPFRGECWQLRPERCDLVRGLIYSVPDPTLPFLGIHLTRKIDGSVLIGPSAILASAREGYRRVPPGIRRGGPLGSQCALTRGHLLRWRSPRSLSSGRRFSRLAFAHARDERCPS